MRREIAAMKLRDYLSLDEEKFRQLFHNSPIKRTKRRGLLRNVCVALGNVGTKDDLPALKKAAADAEPLIAEHDRNRCVAEFNRKRDQFSWIECLSVCEIPGEHRRGRRQREEKIPEPPQHYLSAGAALLRINAGKCVGDLPEVLRTRPERPSRL